MAVVAFGTDQRTWEEEDFTTPPGNWYLGAMGQCYDSRAAMDTTDSLAWITSCDGYTDQSYNSPPTMYQTGPSLFNLDEMNPDALSSGHSTSVPEASRQGQPSLHSPTEEVSPLLAGQSFEGAPQLYGPGSACPGFTSLPEIEDCTPTSQPAPASVADTIPQRSSRSQSKKPPRNPQERLKRTTSDDGNAKSHAKKAHSLVERRYRESINVSIAQLRLALQNTNQVGRRIRQGQGEEADYQQQALCRVRKSDVLLEAVDYVHQTEVELRHMANEIELLKERARQLEKLVKCGDCALMKQLVSFSL